jgi:hypothetical protein
LAESIKAKITFYEAKTPFRQTQQESPSNSARPY